MVINRICRYFTATYADLNLASGGPLLLADPHSNPTFGPRWGWTGERGSATDLVRNRPTGTGWRRACSSPKPGRTELLRVNNAFTFSTLGRGSVVHVDHFYHIVGYDARKKFRESVAYWFLKTSVDAGRTITLCCSVSYSA